jgi:hypothetical protein
MSADRIARTSSAARCRTTPTAPPSADAAHRNQPFEERLLERCRESVQLQRVLAHVRVDAERDAMARIAHRIERRQRDDDLVPHAADIDDEALEMLFDQLACELRDHGACRLVRSASFA